MSRARFSFAGAHAIVTGGSKGIGKGIARVFANEIDTDTVALLDPARLNAIRIRAVSSNQSIAYPNIALNVAVFAYEASLGPDTESFIFGWGLVPEHLPRTTSTPTVVRREIEPGPPMPLSVIWGSPTSPVSPPASTV